MGKPLKFFALSCIILASALSAIRVYIQSFFSEYVFDNSFYYPLVVAGTASIAVTITHPLFTLAWKRSSKLQSIIEVPDFSGRWIGWYRSDLSQDWRKTVHEIIQTPFSCKAVAFGALGNSSTSVTCTVGPGERLYWVYEARRDTQLNDPGGDHQGVHIQWMDSSGSHMSGVYINNRWRQDRDQGRGGTGRFELIRSQNPLRGRIEMDEPNWPDPPASTP